MKFLAHLFTFVALLCLMWVLSAWIPFGHYINTVITLYALWRLADVS